MGKYPPSPRKRLSFSHSKAMTQVARYTAASDAAPDTASNRGDRATRKLIARRQGILDLGGVVQSLEYLLNFVALEIIDELILHFLK